MKINFVQFGDEQRMLQANHLHQPVTLLNQMFLAATTASSYVAKGPSATISSANLVLPQQEMKSFLLNTRDIAVVYE
ncbi:hypothetical protein HanPSC8_Chr04g0179941 [Helianthus annuus]|nr:hypothetical protein HanPSC8_Chr04g0179941 [Helianthus annuus]